MNRAQLIDDIGTLAAFASLCGLAYLIMGLG